METMNVHLHADTAGEAEHCAAFLTITLHAVVSSVTYFKDNAYWFTIQTELTCKRLALALRNAGFKAEVFGTEEYEDTTRVGEDHAYLQAH